MAYQQYRLAMKSEEQRGAAQPNIIRLAFNSDADALTFAANVELAFQADVQTIDTVLRSDYSLPYPAGTNTEYRFVMRDAAGHVQTERVYDILNTTTTPAFATVLTTSGLLLVLPQYSGFGGAIVSAQIAAFQPGQSY